MSSSFGTRLRRYLPPWMRPGGTNTVTITDALGDAMQAAADEADLLRAAGAGNHWDSRYSAYYQLIDRNDDIARIGMGRLLSKRSNETWLQFEARVVAFVGLEDWTAARAHQAYTAVGDVAQYGTTTGLVREVERTGLHVDSLWAAPDDPERWKLLARADMAGRDVDYSMILERGEAHPPGQRLTRLYDRGGSRWVFWLVLTNPDTVGYLADEVRAIVREVKPAWTRCYLWLPGATEWEDLD